MPRMKPKLPIGFASHVPFLTPFSTSGVQWKKIESECGITIPPDLRRAVIARTQTMRNRSDAWQSALTIRETVKQIAGTRRTIVDCLKWLEGLHPDVEAMIMPLETSDQTELVIKPILKEIVVRCDERLVELASIKAPGARHPWEIWIVELAKLFRQYGLRASARKDVDKNKTGPSAFVIFIRELQKLIEPQYKRVADTDDADRADAALSDAINRARNPRKSRASKPVRTTTNRRLSGDKRKTPLRNKPRKLR
jgi:hypothetical protein